MILLTGGTGFIGSNVLAALANQPVVVVDILGNQEKWRNIAACRFERLLHPAQLASFINSPAAAAIKIVIHMGAISSTTERDADLIAAVNIALPQDLWHWCTAKGVRFLYASSASVYGDGSLGFNDDLNLERLNKLRPLNPYAWSKLAFDRFVVNEIALGRSVPPQWAGLRFFNVYGPNEFHKGSQQSVVPQFCRQIVETGSCRLFKSYRAGIEHGDQRRDFVHVDDCVNVLGWLCANPSVSGLFNVGSGIASTFNALANVVFGALGKPPLLEYIDMPESLRAAYQYYTCADLSRLRAAGYHAPMRSLNDGVGEYVSRYLAAGTAWR
ncbi:MAG: ADP-glyceromanno-heptose 6-epimerase [Holosporales bacterium]|jgi:ADP-L-glycero-D-manno-heptose 6-epimerase